MNKRHKICIMMGELLPDESWITICTPEWKGCSCCISNTIKCNEKKVQQ